MEYESVDLLVPSDGARIAARLTLPRGGAEEREGIILFLQGLTPESVLFDEASTAPTALLLHGLASLGLRTVRADKRGTGRSTGDAASTDFDTEVEDYARVLEAALESPRVDPERIYVMGHSVGALIAGLLSRRFAVAGVAAVGACGRRWFECLERGTVRHMTLRGARQDEIDLWLERDRAAFMAPLFEGRPRTFHEQLNEHDPCSVWANAGGDVLVLRGQYDWVVGADEQDMIMGALSRRDRYASRLVVLDGVDHAFTRHASLEASFERYGQGPYDARIVGEVGAWLTGAR